MPFAVNRRTPLLLGAFAAGLGLACQSGAVANPGHCFNNHGDSYCVDQFGEAQPYCAGPGESCAMAGAIDGCVAELPASECYSPCGGGALIDEDDACLTADETSGDGDGDGDGEGDGDGDGDGEPGPACGDATVDGDEECDDGNAVEDDDCTNACTTPRCGDAVIHAQLDETCDDGNLSGGDGCAANCLLSGTLMWSVYSDVGVAKAVAISEDGTIGVLASGGLGTRVVTFDPAGQQQWSELTLETANDLAAGLDGSFVVAGAEMGTDEGLLRAHGSDGSEDWTALGSMFPSTVRAVATAANGSIVSVGNISDVGYIARHSAAGDPDVEFSIPSSSALQVLAAGPDGSIWTIVGEPNQLIHFSPDNVEIWTSVALGALVSSYADLSVSPSDDAYVVGNGDTFQSIGIARYDPDGELVWTSVLDHPASSDIALAISALPSGGAVVAGLTSEDGQSESVGLLAWFDEDGEVAGDYVYDRRLGVDQDILYAIAVAPDGSVVVAGAHEPDGGESQVWIIKVAI